MMPHAGPDLEALTDVVKSSLGDLFLHRTTLLTRGEVFALFDVLGNIVGESEPAISGPFLGTRKTLRDEFEFEAFKPRGTAAFRQRKTNRVLYLAIEGDEFLIGMYDSRIDNSAAFVSASEALAWIRGADAGRRKTNILWQLP